MNELRSVRGQAGRAFIGGVLLLGLVFGCEDQTSLEEGLVECSADGDCPSGYTCAEDQTCRLPEAMGGSGSVSDPDIDSDMDPTQTGSCAQGENNCDVCGSDGSCEACAVGYADEDSDGLCDAACESGTIGGCWPVSCAELSFVNPMAQTGVHALDLEPFANNEPAEGYCDMDTDGGGWTLVLNYVHASGTNPALQERTSALPLLGGELGADESGTDFWGHASNELMLNIAPLEMRVYGESSGHARTLDFVHLGGPAGMGCIEYFVTGIGDCSSVTDEFSTMVRPGHDAILPLGATDFAPDQGGEAMLNQPFSVPGFNQWSIGIDGAWEMDDAPGDAQNDTVHRVFVR